MTQLRNYHFVLWGEGFDEIAAAIFVTKLREAGLLVKVVALHAQQLAGANGLALVPDFTLGQALKLVGQTAAVIMPCTGPELLPFTVDPRLSDFLAQAQLNNACLVIKESPQLETPALPLPPIMFYAPAAEALFSFIENLIEILQTRNT
ncbi:MAG: hypothetical protein H6631_02920 [Anaerolineaceae bacterium]|nr:hypothetical protein [Anaerolineaceae bacterium]MCB9099646.1 hypothetical protein [Anaerolineales bacterium]